MSHGDDAPCIQIRKLVSGMAWSERDNRWLLILQFFFDETGYATSGNGEAFIFAGFLGSVRAWEQFAHGWEPILNRRPVLDADGLKTCVRRRPNSRRIRDFVQVLTDCRDHLCRVSVTIPRKAYETAVLAEIPERRDRLGLDTETIDLISNEYYLAFYTIIMDVLLGMVWSLGDKAQLEVIYDKNIQEAEKVESGYQEFVRQTPEARQLRDKPRGEDDNEFIPLQAADMLAWHMHKDFVETQHGRKHQGKTWAALSALNTYPPKVLDEGDLRRMINWDEIERRWLAERARG